MTRVFGQEAAAVELRACGVVRVMLRFWCVDGPHSGSGLTLPECFKLMVQSAEWLDNPAEGGRGWGWGGQSVKLRHCAPPSRQPGQLGPACVAVEVITASLVTWRWKRCQPLSHGVGVRTVVFERVPIAQASADY